jgi:serine/threonine-protein kinase
VNSRGELTIEALQGFFQFGEAVRNIPDGHPTSLADGRSGAVATPAIGRRLSHGLAHDQFSRDEVAIVRTPAEPTRAPADGRAVVGLAALAAVAAGVGLVGTLFQARTARAERDFATRQLRRAEAINDLNAFLLSDAAPSGKPFTVDDLLGSAEQIVRRQRDRADPSRVDILVSIGRQYALEDEQKRAMGVLSEAYELSRSIDDRSIRARASCALGNALARGRDTDQGERLVDEGLREVGGDPQLLLDRIFCLGRSSEVARLAGRSADAIARSQEAVQAVNELPFHSAMTEYHAEQELAESYRDAGRATDAIAIFERTATLLSALGRDRTQAAGTLFNNWALALYDVGRPRDAADLFRRAIDISRDDRQEQTVSPMLLNNYARVLRDLGRYDEAADYAERAYARAGAAGAEVVINQSLLTRAEIYSARGDPVRAVAMLQEVEPRLRKALPAGHVAFAAVQRGYSTAALARGDLPAALDYTSAAIALFDTSIKAGGTGVDTIIGLFGRRADIERQLGQVDRAVSDAEQGLTLALAHVAPGSLSALVGRAQLARGRALEAKGKPAEAAADYEAAVRQLETTVGPDRPETQAARQLAADSRHR